MRNPSDPKGPSFWARLKILPALFEPLQLLYGGKPSASRQTSLACFMQNKLPHWGLAMRQFKIMLLQCREKSFIIKPRPADNWQNPLDRLPDFWHPIPNIPQIA